jgi:hypothetical protein
MSLLKLEEHPKFYTRADIWKVKTKFCETQVENKYLKARLACHLNNIEIKNPDIYALLLADLLSIHEVRPFQYYWEHSNLTNIKDAFFAYKKVDHYQKQIDRINKEVAELNF